MRGYRLGVAVGSLSRRNRCRDRSTRRPAPMSHPLAIPPATRSTRSTWPRPVGDPSSASAARRAWPAASGAATSPLASVGSMCSRQFVEQVAVVAQQVRPAGSSTGTRSRPASSVHQRQQLVAHPVAQERRVEVAGIVDDVDPQRMAEPGRSSPGAGRGSVVAGRDASRPGPVRRRTAHQVDQHRLGLVVGGVTGHDVVGQHRVAGRRVPAPPGSARAARRPSRRETSHRTGPRPSATTSASPRTQGAARGRRALR